ncbi:MAG TPA: VOC family protein [Gammaproteobacteria bacterium]|nr:VOC family protein [Gammaproteobacteria bacterium]
MEIQQIDHLVLTVRDIPTTLDFYTQVLGMRAIRFGEGRHALAFGRQKINLHQAGREFEPKAAQPLPGSADLCLLTDTDIKQVIAHLKSQDIAIIAGPVKRTGATGALLSVYIRDPDANLLEISNRV